MGTHTHNGILLSHKKERNNAICSNMDGPSDYHTRWSKSDKDKYDITYMWNLECNTNELVYKKKNRLRGVEYKLMITKGKEVRDELWLWE